jgi:cytochrome P450
MSYTSVPASTEPVTDWVNDWDWLDDGWGRDAISIFNGIREQCPVAMTERYGRAFMPVTMEAVSAIAHDTQHFSSVYVSVARPDATRHPAPPITTDPPDHMGHRRLLLPSFSPKRIAPMEEDLRAYCRLLIQKLEGDSVADAAAQYSQHIPVHGICELLGIPETDADMFRDWIYRNFQLAPRDNAVRAQLQIDMTEYIDVLLRSRLEHPQDDLMNLIAHGEIEGVPVDWDLKLGYVRLMILAGIDTTWSSIGSGLWHFAQNPEQIARLVGVSDDDPLWMNAVEEVLRYYAPVTMGRKVIEDVTISGCPMRANEQVLVTFPAANHDPAAFDNPEIFDIDRQHNRHVAFGLGIHRCLGSNLARLEVTVALQAWLRAFPNYSLDNSQQTTWANGQVRGPRNIPVLLGTH